MLANLSSYLQLDTLLYRVLAFLVASTIHDAVHALIARWLGDKTHHEQGRLTLNPLAHIEPLGLAMVIFGPYGWTKPLSFSKDRFQRHSGWSITAVYLFAPIVNLLLGILFWWLYFVVPFSFGESTWLTEIWIGFVQYSIIINLLYFFVHVIPIYPLDGWFVLRGWVPDRIDVWLQRNERYGLIFVLALMITPMGQWALGRLYPIGAQLVMNLFSL